MECLLRTNMRQNLQVGRPGRPGRARVLGAAHTCENRRAVIGSVVQTALPTKNPRDRLDHGQGLHVGRPTPTSSSSCSRRSYSAESGSESNSENNLLQTNKPRVMDYINRLNNYDISEIANITVGSELNEEALVLFEKTELLIDCISPSSPRPNSRSRAHRRGGGLCVMLGKV